MIDPLELHALADNELTVEERARVLKALESNPQAQLQLREIERLKACLATKATTPDVEASWQACVGRLNEIDGTKKVEGFVGRYAWVLCAVFFLVIFGGGFLNRAGAGNVKTGELELALSNMSPLSVPTTQEPAAVRQWANEVLGTVLNDKPMRQMRVYGAGEAIMGDRRVACIRMADVHGPLMLLVIPNVQSVEGVAPLDETGKYHAGQINGVPCVTWMHGTQAIVVVGDRGVEDLYSVAQLLESAN